MQVHAFEATLHSPDQGGEREIVIAVDIEGTGTPLEDACLHVMLVDETGGVLWELDAVPLGVVQPGRQLKTVRVRTRMVAPAIEARWSITAQSRVWRGPVRALSTGASHAPPPDAPVEARPLPTASGGPAPAPAPWGRRREAMAAAVPPAAGAASPPAPPLARRWTRAAQGDPSVVEEEFEGTSLDMQGRDRVRDMLRSGDPAVLAIGCRICAATNWRTAAQNMRQLLVHESQDVRAAAAEAIGRLAGPAMEHYLKPLLDDPEASVREAAHTAISRLA
ncbi:MAG: HEAT repeat domain-containing protein, partial [Myxococcota bacterium]|nr:HEAT repeat domain-containing protein [Myxococcota bacterium]